MPVKELSEIMGGSQGDMEISCAYDTASQNRNSQHQRKKVCLVILGVYPLVVMNEKTLCELRAAEKVNRKECETPAYYWGNTFEGLIIQFKIWKRSSRTICLWKTIEACLRNLLGKVMLSFSSLGLSSMRLKGSLFHIIAKNPGNPTFNSIFLDTCFMIYFRPWKTKPRKIGKWKQFEKLKISTTIIIITMTVIIS